MSRYIDAYEAKNEIRKRKAECDRRGDRFTIGIVEASLDYVESADVKPVRHGHWIEQGAGYNWSFVCSQCGYVDGFPFNERMKECPNCFAKMDGKEDKNE